MATCDIDSGGTSEKAEDGGEEGGGGGGLGAHAVIRQIEGQAWPVVDGNGNGL